VEGGGVWGGGGGNKKITKLPRQAMKDSKDAAKIREQNVITSHMTIKETDHSRAYWIQMRKAPSGEHKPRERGFANVGTSFTDREPAFRRKEKKKFNWETK